MDTQLPVPEYASSDRVLAGEAAVATCAQSAMVKTSAATGPTLRGTARTPQGWRRGVALTRAGRPILPVRETHIGRAG